MHQQDVAIVQAVGAQIFRNALFITTDAQDVECIIFTQTRVFDARTNETRGGEYYDFRDADVVEIEVGATQILQPIVGS